MRKHVILLLAGIVLFGAGCTHSNVPEDLFYLDGLWGLTTEKVAPASGRYEEYVRFHTDNSFEYYYVTAKASVYHWGSYEILQGDVLLTYKGLRRFDIADSIPRYTDDYYTENSLDKNMITILEYGLDKMVMKTGNGKCYFFKVTEMYGWNEEFSAPAITVTEQALLGQWDQLDFYQYGWQGTSWWYFYEPEKNGVTLAEEGVMTDCPFWTNRVLEKMINAGKLTTSEQIDVEPADCSWSLSTDTLTMTCSRYVAYTPDAQGNHTAEHTETPEQPVIIRFLVQRLTPNYLILYNSETMLFHAFYKQITNVPPSAPQQRNSSPDGRCQAGKSVATISLITDNRKIDN
jgi:hypothetical protein